MGRSKVAPLLRDWWTKHLVGKKCIVNIYVYVLNYTGGGVCSAVHKSELCRAPHTGDLAHYGPKRGWCGARAGQVRMVWERLPAHWADSTIVALGKRKEFSALLFQLVWGGGTVTSYSGLRHAAWEAGSTLADVCRLAGVCQLPLPLL